MFNRRSFMALLGLIPFAVKSKVQAEGHVVAQALAITEALSPGQTRLHQQPVLPGTVCINYQELTILDDGNGNLRTSLVRPMYDLSACPVVGQINYQTGELSLSLTPHPAMVRYQTWL